MKRVAMYARYSTESQSERSIHDQFRNCEHYTEKEGWVIVGKYFDEAITGAVSKRPDYKRLMQDAEKGVFEVLLIDDLSRFARDDLEMKISLKKLMAWGIRVIGVSEGYDTTNKGHKIHAGMRGIMNEMYIDDVREKTHRGLTGKVLEGFSHGGRCYGYKSSPIEHDTKRDEHGRPLIIACKRLIAEEEGKWVIRIFEWFAEGKTTRWIAGELNRLGVPSSRGGTWSASAIYGVAAKQTGMLNNPLYIGKVVWNRRQWGKDPETGKRRYVKRPVEEWIEQEQPELRIISDELWENVQKRKRKTSEKYKDLRVKPAPHKYLFSGLLVCGQCGMSYSIVNRDTYGCTGHVNRGTAFCRNSKRISRNIVERKLVETLKGYLFNEEAIAIFTREIEKQLGSQLQERDSMRQHLRQQLLQTKKEQDNVFEAIRQGIVTHSIKGELERLESLYSDLTKQYDALDQDLGALRRCLPVAKEMLGEMMERLNNVLNKDVQKARLLLADMIHGKILLHPTEHGYLEAEMRGDYSTVVEMIDGLENVVKTLTPRNQNATCNQIRENIDDFADRCNQLGAKTCNHSSMHCRAGCGGRI